MIEQLSTTPINGLGFFMGIVIGIVLGAALFRERG